MCEGAGFFRVRGNPAFLIKISNEKEKYIDSVASYGGWNSACRV